MITAALASICLSASLQPGLVCNNPSKDALALIRLMRGVYGKQTISGQCDDKYVPYIMKHSEGKEPAMIGYDFNGIVPSQNNNRDVEKAIAFHKRGGIVQIQWHWISPNADGDFYTNKFDLKAALADPQSTSYKNLVRDIDIAGSHLARLRDAGVPVLWRPLHEAEGKWFWWGKSGGESCRALYNLMFDRFERVHKLNNLIWVWTSYGKEKENWYPGDDKVDMIVRDYESPTAWSEFSELFGKSNKMFALGEEGRLTDPETVKARPWLYFLTWAYMIEDPKKGNTPYWIHRVYNDPRVITLSDMPSLWKSVGIKR